MKCSSVHSWLFVNSCNLFTSEGVMSEHHASRVCQNLWGASEMIAGALSTTGGTGWIMKMGNKLVQIVTCVIEMLGSTADWEQITVTLSSFRQQSYFVVSVRRYKKYNSLTSKHSISKILSPRSFWTCFSVFVSGFPAWCSWPSHWPQDDQDPFCSRVSVSVMYGMTSGWESHYCHYSNPEEWRRRIINHWFMSRWYVYII